MRISWKSATFLIIASLLAACSIPSKITVYEMESFEKVKEDTALEITNEEEIKVFSKAVRSAKKEPGAVDTLDPGYKFLYDQKSYYLWVGPGSGSIMEATDTHTIYTLQKDSAKQVYKIVTDH
ncbi:hypothetical protein [Halobacillus salinus]|uniref:hypothetical protein n=1 Tax=Halobacillus salinus TaxID=192814 RepID=UPI0009A7AAAA|nr:hypothetical protein [Halobacillus salinus]